MSCLPCACGFGYGEDDEGGIFRWHEELDTVSLKLWFKVLIARVFSFGYFDLGTSTIVEFLSKIPLFFFCKFRLGYLLRHYLLKTNRPLTV